jgi:hypothetical protein
MFVLQYPEPETTAATLPKSLLTGTIQTMKKSTS